MHLAYIWIVSHLSAKNYQNWCKFDEVLTKTNLLSFFGTRLVSRILYALPVWGGFLTVELKNRINAFFKRLRRFGYINCVMTIDDLIERSDYELFTKVCCGSHSLHHLLPPYRTSDLRLRGHPFQLPDYSASLATCQPQNNIQTVCFNA